MKRLLNKKVVALGLAVGITLGIGGAAFAYFTSTGSGTGSATAGNTTAVTIAQVGAVTGLVPGGPSETVTYKVTNPGTGSEYVNQVTVAVTSISGAGSLTGAGVDACTTSSFSVTQGAPLATDITAGGTATGSATISLPDDGNNQDNCEGVTLTLSFTSN